MNQPRIQGQEVTSVRQRSYGSLNLLNPEMFFDDPLERVQWIVNSEIENEVTTLAQILSTQEYNWKSNRVWSILRKLFEVPLAFCFVVPPYALP